MFTQLVKKFPAFYGPESLLPFWQDPTAITYPEPDELNSHPFNVSLYIPL
jgi:hypothetical protein